MDVATVVWNPKDESAVARSIVQERIVLPVPDAGDGSRVEDLRGIRARVVRGVGTPQSLSAARVDPRAHDGRDLRAAAPAADPRRRAFDGSSAMRGTIRRATRKAGAIRRRLFESPEVAAWRRAWHRAETTPRFTPGRIRMLDYDLQYSDLLSFCPQWQDIFVKRVLDFQPATDAPRILDCGANVGLASLYFKRAFPRARHQRVRGGSDDLRAARNRILKETARADVDCTHAAVVDHERHAHVSMRRQ